MNAGNLNDRLQLLATFGVILGLIFVATEIRQQHEIARAQLASDSYQSLEEFNRSAQDQTISRLLILAETSPESMTPEEQLILSAYYFEVISVFPDRHQWFEERGFFEVDPAQMAILAGSIIFASEYGRAWWQVYRGNFLPGVQALMDAVEEGDQEFSFVEDSRRIMEDATQRMSQ